MISPLFKSPAAANDNIGVWIEGEKSFVHALGLTREFSTVLEAKTFIDFIQNPIPGKFKYQLKDQNGTTLVHTNDWNTVKHWYRKYSGRAT